MRPRTRTSDMARSQPARLLVVVTVWMALLPGCGVRGLAFVQDDRLRILAPADRATVTLPLEVKWSVRDFDSSPPGAQPAGDGYFALFFDRSPVGPGRRLASVANDDLNCRRTPGCPDDVWYRANGIYRVAETSLVVDSLLDTRPKHRKEAPDRHELSIVLIGADGRRIGETGAHITFTVERDDD